MKSDRSPTRELCAFVSSLGLADIPAPVVDMSKALLLDWLASALAGRGARPVEVLDRFAADMGPAEGPAEVLPTRRTSSPYFAAMVNAAASHVVEQDDVHNGSVFHPATVVFPAVLAVAQAQRRSGAELLVSAIAGYETGIRIGEFLGRSHYRVFHTTGTAGTLAAAAAVGRLIGLDEERMTEAFGSAGTQAAGLWEFLRDAADSKQLHCAHAASAGLLSALAAGDGLTGARRILEGEQGMAAGMSSDADPSRLIDGLGSRWATTETSFKYFASCRHTHPAADALKALREREGLRPEDIAAVVAHVHQAAIDVLGPVHEPQTIHQAKFSMGTVLGLIAVHGQAGLGEFERYALTDERVRAFRAKVAMKHDPEIDAAYPRRWIGRVQVRTVDGRVLESRVDVPKGDPGNPLTRAELEDKAIALFRFRDTATAAEARTLIDRVWALDSAPEVGRLLPPLPAG